MEKNIILRKYDYAIPLSSTLFSGSDQNWDNEWDLDQLLMKVAIDFEMGQMYIKGCSDFMTLATDKAIMGRKYKKREGMVIETDIYPATIIDLSRQDFGEVSLSLQGRMKTGKCLRFCTGSLQLNKENNNSFNQWYLSFSLFGTRHDDFEIKFKFPVYTFSFEEAKYN